MYDDSERAGLNTVSQFVPRFFLSDTVSMFFNNSLSEDIVLECCKTAKIIQTFNLVTQIAIYYTPRE